MPISRLRLELAAWFAAAVLVSVSAVDAGLTVYLRRQADARFASELQRAAAGLLSAVRQEQQSGATMADAVKDALSEWPAGPDAFVIYARDTAAIGVRGGADLVALATPQPPGGALLWTGKLPSGHAARMALARDVVQPPIAVVAIRPTTELTEYAEVLTGWLLFSIPGVTAFALVAGYFLARRALRPLNAAADRIAAINPSDLAGRLPVRTPPDEIDRLAEQFNALLARLADLRQQNREFLSRAAHQLKTPLTLVRGESELGLERERDAEAYRAILVRIGRAADQMTHRVDDLFLLARAEAGDQPPLTDAIELDGLTLECTDLMRGRAQRAQRALALDRVSGDMTHGNAPLLREALLELLENAIRHGSGAAPIRVSAYAEAGQAHLAVTSDGPEPPTQPERGLGLSIVRWIASIHGGTLTHRRVDGTNTFDLSWPLPI